MLHFLKEHLNINSANNCYISKSLLSIKRPCRNLLLRTVSPRWNKSLKAVCSPVTASCRPSAHWWPTVHSLVPAEPDDSFFSFLPGSTKGTWVVCMDWGVQECCPHAVPGNLKPSLGLRASRVCHASSLSAVRPVPPHTSFPHIYGDFLTWFVLPSSVLFARPASSSSSNQVQPKRLCQFNGDKRKEHRIRI